MRTMRLALPLVAALGLSACGDLNPTQQRVATGALGGGAVGGVLGSFSGNTGLGALLGAGVGGAGGFLYDQSQSRYEPRYDDRRGPPRRYRDERRYR
ncbi:glycine zipper domain-containing protein [Falsiroseomonas sp. HC035]|uniref:glycine zipper domain-containing protein n=1 Tax=Falsiroseomonas sp. HC035 TaxID=3390999 RepID=UPI003D3117A1